MSASVLVIGDVRIEAIEGHALQQSYRPLGEPPERRTQSGLLVERPHWRALETTISGVGWWAPPLLALKSAGELALSCIEPMTWPVPVATRTLTLPTDARPDAPLFGYGLFANGERETVNVARVGRDVTLAEAPGATSYLVVWWPQLNVKVRWATLDGDRGQRQSRWSLQARTTRSNLAADGSFAA